eukprot:Trichotokara_eunicae@DN7046_c0_g1_i1.p1
MAQVLEGRPREWDLFLAAIAFSYRITPHPATLNSPFFLNYGPDPVLPQDRELLGDVSSSLSVQRDSVVKARHWASAALRAAQGRAKAYYDRGRREVVVKVNDLVLVRKPPGQLAGDESGKLVCLNWRPIFQMSGNQLTRRLFCFGADRTS